VNRSSPSRLDAAHWLALWEQCSRLPPSLQPCALLAPLLPAHGAGRDDGPDAHPEHWPLGRRDAALFDLHAALFGPALTAAARCPSCGEQIDLSLSTDQLRVEGATAAANGCLASDGWQVDWRLPNSLDLAAAASCATSASASSSASDIAGDEGAAQRVLLQRCVQSVRRQGATLDSAALPPFLVQQLAADMAAADPQALTELALQCPACLHSWTEVFDIGAFLMQRLAHWAETTLDQVHVLARAYGWTEAETLGLSPIRRAQYLARVQA
jgi:hypothetical protein